MAPPASLTVVAPFYNEQETIAAFYKGLSAVVDRLGRRCDFVFVDDGSDDRTLELLNDLADRDPRITVLSLTRNLGHQLALTAGLDHAEGDIVVSMDSDLQHPPETIPQMIREYEKGVDVVYAVRKDARRVGMLKRTTSRLHYALMKHTANVQVIPEAADFRLISRRAALALREMRETHRYLRGMVPWLGFAHAVVSYEQPDRFAGGPRFTFRKSLRLAQDGLFHFSRVPLAFVSWTGFLLTGLSFVYLCYIVVMKLQDRTVSGWASLAALVLILGGVQLISIGVLAQYIGVLFDQVKQRPLYILKMKRLAREPARGDIQT